MIIYRYNAHVLSSAGCSDMLNAARPAGDCRLTMRKRCHRHEETACHRIELVPPVRLHAGDRRGSVPAIRLSRRRDHVDRALLRGRCDGYLHPCAGQRAAGRQCGRGEHLRRRTVHRYVRVRQPSGGRPLPDHPEHHRPDHHAADLRGDLQRRGLPLPDQAGERQRGRGGGPPGFRA